MIRTLFILWLSIASILSADIRGRLLDTTGRPLPATPLTIEETGDSTSTDLDGGFSLPLPSGTYTLEILDQKVSVVFNEGEVPDIRILVFTHAVSARSNAMETITLSEKTLDRSPGFTLTEALASEADIHMVGIGGALATVSIGGLAKHRVQTTVGGYRVSGDRRAGSDMGTLIPSLLDGITVMKGGTATSYGSEAMGGVVDALLPAFRPVTGISAGILYGENNQRKTFDFQAKGDRWILAGAYDDADSYKTAEGEEEDGFFTRENFYGGYLLQDDRRHTTLDLLYTRGTDIGKPSSSSKPTLYPENILSVAGVRSYGELWQYQAGAIYQKLVTERSGERSTITSTNVQGSIIGTLDVPHLDSIFTPVRAWMQRSRTTTAQPFLWMERHTGNSHPTQRPHSPLERTWISTSEPGFSTSGLTQVREPPSPTISYRPVRSAFHGYMGPMFCQLASFRPIDFRLWKNSSTKDRLGEDG